MSNELRFASEAAAPETLARSPWTLLIVDDESEVHAVTELALSGFTFVGRKLHFLHAHSGAEARQVLSQRQDVALVLLDVVMETERAGLDVVEFVRNELRNRFIRIILRTGQPGQAPELHVITRYDINDYKYKTELTSERLFTAVYTGLSTYRDLMALDANRRGLEKVIEASARIFELRSMDHFAQGVLEQLAALLFIERDAVMVHVNGVAAEDLAGASTGSALRIIAATGALEKLVGRDGSQLPPQVLARLEAARSGRASTFGPDFLVGYQDGSQPLLFYVETAEPISLPDRTLIELFYRNVGIARENLRLHNPQVH